MDNLTSQNRIKELMKKHNVRFSKSLGQNFLTDQFLIDEIIEKSNILEDDYILEVGPGIGGLTKSLAESAKKVVAVELDRKLIPVLKETMADYDNVTIIQSDILKVDINNLIDTEFGAPAKVVANLPYYITTPIIMKFLEEHINVTDIVVMVQKEVADRMVSKSGTKAYGSLSVAVQYYCEAMIVIDVPREHFIPQPNVDSAVIRLTVRENPPVKVLNDDFFFELVKGAFALRRKTLLNSLSKSRIKIDKELMREVLNELGIQENIRGEKLEIEDFANIANLLYKKSQN